MYRILIIDDEAIVLDTYTHIIKNNYDNIEVETARTGVEGLLKLEAFRPHVVITDIRMPGMSGLEFIKEARTFDQTVKILIVSAYEQFEYAHESFKYNVEDYILKPVTKKKLMETIGKTIGTIEKENQRRDKELESIERYYKSIGLLESNFLINIVQGRKFSHHLYREIFSLKLKRGRFITIQFPTLKETTNWNTVEDYHAKIQECSEYLKIQIKYSFQCLIGNLAIDRIYLYLESEDGESNDNLFHFFEKIQKNILKKFGLSTRISIGSKKELAEIFASYEETIYNLTYSRKNVEIFLGRHAVDHDIEVFVELLEKVYEYFLQKNEKMTSVLRKAVRLYEPLLVAHEEQMVRALMETYILIYRLARETNIVSKEVYQSKVYLNEFLNLTAIAKIVDFDKNIRIFFKLYKNLESANFSEITVQALELIEAHRFETVSLENAAREIGVTPQYLSRIFKIDTSKSFKEYHKELRMGEAKKLLAADQLSIREISDQLGFNDYNYFIRTFKKTVGCTPTEYRG
ncbi:response regulator [Gottschalkiaceae bacterium SANA]|nr:response regulator [Gottschalkiaceae bacterium SANA]